MYDFFNKVVELKKLNNKYLKLCLENYELIAESNPTLNLNDVLICDHFDSIKMETGNDYLNMIDAFIRKSRLNFYCKFIRYVHEHTENSNYSVHLDEDIVGEITKPYYYRIKLSFFDVRNKMLIEDFNLIGEFYPHKVPDKAKMTGGFYFNSKKTIQYTKELMKRLKAFTLLICCKDDKEIDDVYEEINNYCSHCQRSCGCVTNGGE